MNPIARKRVAKDKFFDITRYTKCQVGNKLAMDTFKTSKTLPYCKRT
jgi:hypothetical protein